MAGAGRLQPQNHGFTVEFRTFPVWLLDGSTDMLHDQPLAGARGSFAQWLEPQHHVIFVDVQRVALVAEDFEAERFVERSRGVLARRHAELDLLESGLAAGTVDQSGD